MREQEISRPEWAPFLDSFTRLHAEAIVNMNVSGATIGGHDAIVSRPLRGISTDGDSVLIQIGDDRGAAHLSHRVAHARTLSLRQTDEGADAALEFIASNGTRTILRFRSPMLPELLDPAVE